MAAGWSWCCPHGATAARAGTCLVVVDDIDRLHADELQSVMKGCEAAGPVRREDSSRRTRVLRHLPMAIRLARACGHQRDQGIGGQGVLSLLFDGVRAGVCC